MLQTKILETVQKKILKQTATINPCQMVGVGNKVQDRQREHTNRIDTQPQWHPSKRHHVH
jgi:hypothetical protein